MTAEATVRSDSMKAADLWRTTDPMWWEGQNDPNVCVIQVELLNAEIWDGPSMIAVEVLEFIKAHLTGQKANLGKPKDCYQISMTRTSGSIAHAPLIPDQLGVDNKVGNNQISMGVYGQGRAGYADVVVAMAGGALDRRSAASLAIAITAFLVPLRMKTETCRAGLYREREVTGACCQVTDTSAIEAAAPPPNCEV
jgi:hypothetical protein